MTIKEYRTRVAVGSDLFRAHPGVDFVRWSVEVSELFVSILFCSALCDSVSNNGVLEIYHNPSYVDKSGGGLCSAVLFQNGCQKRTLRVQLCRKSDFVFHENNRTTQAPNFNIYFLYEF